MSIPSTKGECRSRLFPPSLCELRRTSPVFAKIVSVVLVFRLGYDGLAPVFAKIVSVVLVFRLGYDGLAPVFAYLVCECRGLRLTYDSYLCICYHDRVLSSKIFYLK